MPSPLLHSYLRLTLTPGLGPILIQRAVALFGSPDAVLAANQAALRNIKGIGKDKAPAIHKGLADSAALADEELKLAEYLGITLVSVADEPATYPPLLKQIPDPPPILYIRGRLDPAHLDQYSVAIVGSRSCTAYGIEQAERFAAALAQAGITIISGGARGIDTAAHRAALRSRGRTVAVLGCGLSSCYPPDNEALFRSIADGESGAVISELPLRTPPTAENFPARNRIISGLSLGTLVIEAGHRSGALITARVAAEDHGREVFALPSRVDSAASAGSLELIKSGGALMVTHPDDVLSALESPARHHFDGTHDARFTPLAHPTPEPKLFEPTSNAAADFSRDTALTDTQRLILQALEREMSLDDLARTTGSAPGSLRADLTILEIRRRVQRNGTLISRR